MKMWQGGMVVVLAAMIGAAGATLLSPAQKASAQADAAKISNGPRYSVIETHGHNLLVTDNTANKLYFYSTDKDKPIGSPLKLRAEVDLTKVGKDEITIKTHTLEKVEDKKAEDTKKD